MFTLAASVLILECLCQGLAFLHCPPQLRLCRTLPLKFKSIPNPGDTTMSAAFLVGNIGGLDKPRLLEGGADKFASEVSLDRLAYRPTQPGVLQGGGWA